MNLLFGLEEEQAPRVHRFSLFKFFILLAILVCFYAGIFHLIMIYEGRKMDVFDGVYWTLTMMSTLGLGDITFNSTLGKVFAMLVLFSGIIIFIMLLPFIFVRYIYAPWADAKNKARNLRYVNKNASGHVLIVGSNEVALNVASGLHSANVKYYLVVADPTVACSLNDDGYSVVCGGLDLLETYENAQISKAALVIILEDDYKAANVAATVREISPSIQMACNVENANALTVLRFAGCEYVFHIANLIANHMAKRIFVGGNDIHIVASFEDLSIAEMLVKGEDLENKKISDIKIFEKFNVNIIGILDATHFQSPMDDFILSSESLMLISGSRENLENFNKYILEEINADAKVRTSLKAPVLVIGAGRVGSELIKNLSARKIDFRVVEKERHLVPKNDPRYIIGDATDPLVLTEAGLIDTGNVLITPRNDDLNIYLTLACRKLRPDVKIIAHCHLPRNDQSLYHVGANVVLSYVNLATVMMLNCLNPGSIFMLTEGINLFNVKVVQSLVGKKVAEIEAKVERETHCRLVGVRKKDKTVTGALAEALLENGDSLIFAGSFENEKKFMDLYQK